ncbi:MAG: hypothetical protein RR310_03720 [Eubacterium sp.]
MNESEIKTLFLDIVGTLNLCRDVNMETSTGEVVEYGMTITDTSFITYRESNRSLHFYVEGDEILSVDEDSPLLFMMRELFVEVDEGDPIELKRARLKILE